MDWNKKTAVEVNHQDLARVIDIFVNVEGLDVGSVAADIEKLLEEWGGMRSTAEQLADGVVNDRVAR